MARINLFAEHDNYRGDGTDIPPHLLKADVEKALLAFRPLKEFQYVEFHQGKPTYVFLMEDHALKELGIRVPAIFLGDQPRVK